MAQNIILKRSSQSGKVPTTSSLNLGEIALNTYDGRAFIHKSGSTESVEHIVVTNSITTGSINITQTGSFGEISVTNDLNVGDSVFVTNDVVVGGDVDVVGAVTASVFVGDGSQLTGISAGATDNEIPTNNWDYNLPDSGTLSDGNNQSTKYTVDFLAESLMGRPVGYQTFITNDIGTTEIIPGTDSIKFIVNNIEVGKVDAGGIVGTTPMGTISSSAQIAALGYVTSSSGGTIPDGTISGSSQLTASFDIRYALSASYLTSLNGALSSSIQVLGGTDIYSSSAQLPNGLISGSSQLTSSYDTRYTLSGSVQPLPSGVVSGSSQVTDILTSLNTFTASNANTSLNAATSSYLTSLNGAISSSSQLTSSYDLRYLITGSVTSSILQLNTFTASNANTSLNAFTASNANTSLNAFTASNANTSLNLFTSSLNTWSSSVATTGSNSFNGNQTITGSLTVSSVSSFSASVIANSSSLTLNSGSNLYIQNNGLAEITGSLVVSGSTTINNYRIDDAWTSYSVAWTADSSNPTLNNGTLTGYYKLIGKTCFVRVKLIIGSTTSVGSGAWQFSLPFTAASADGVQFPCSMLDNTVAWYAGVVNGTYSGLTTKSAILCTTSGTHAFGAVTPTTPFTWGTGDSLMFNGSYEIA